jgi:hypothetical protein
MTTAARIALLGYYAEKLDLLREIDGLTNHAYTKASRYNRASAVRRYRAAVARHLKATAIISDALAQP